MQVSCDLGTLAALPPARQSSVEVEVTLRPTVSGPWWQAPICDRRPICLSPWNFLQTVVWLLFCSALSDERTGLYFVVQLLLGPARAVTLRSKSRRTQAIFYCLIETPPTWRARSPYLYLPGTGWPSYTVFEKKSLQHTGTMVHRYGLHLRINGTDRMRKTAWTNMTEA
jgi:hypothetical protein